MAEVNRRDFVKTSVGAGVAAGVLGAVRTASARVVGANDRINLAVIGVGGRGYYLLNQFLAIGKANNSLQVVKVCDVYQKRATAAASRASCASTLDYREIINDKSIDAVVIATPDHWHAPLAIAAMKAGKDVYLEKPMTKTVEEAKEVYEVSKATNRILQIGSQTTSSDQWWKARKFIADGVIGKMIMSQGSYHRNSTEGEWNWPIDQAAGPSASGEEYIDWKTWLGNTETRPYNADRFFRFRKYWDYSGGIATDLFYHVIAPLNLCWGNGEFPYRVAGTGGIYVFKDEREVPDTFMLVADYPSGHSVVLSSSMANSRHIPGLIRGHDGTIVMVEHGMFEGRTDYITITPEQHKLAEFEEKYGTMELKVPVLKNRPAGVNSLPNNEPSRASHYDNFIDCVKSRETPVLNGELAYKAMVTIALSVESYRKGQMMYFDTKAQKVSEKPIRI